MILSQTWGLNSMSLLKIGFFEYVTEQYVTIKNYFFFDKLLYRYSLNNIDLNWIRKCSRGVSEVL